MRYDDLDRLLAALGGQGPDTDDGTEVTGDRRGSAGDDEPRSLASQPPYDSGHDYRLGHPYQSRYLDERARSRGLGVQLLVERANRQLDQREHDLDLRRAQIALAGAGTGAGEVVRVGDVGLDRSGRVSMSVGGALAWLLGAFGAGWVACEWLGGGGRRRRRLRDDWWE